MVQDLVQTDGYSPVTRCCPPYRTKGLMTTPVVQMWSDFWFRLLFLLLLAVQCFLLCSPHRACLMGLAAAPDRHERGS